MKLWKKLIIPLAVLVVLIAGLLIIKLLPDGNETEVPESTASNPSSKEEPGLPTFSQADVAELRISTPSGESFTYVKGSGSAEEEIIWEYEDEKNPTAVFPLSQGAISSTVATLISYSETSNIPDGMANLEEFGLDTPAYTVEILTAEGETRLISIGNLTFDESGVYCISDKSKAVSIVSKTKREACEKNILDFLEKKIFSFVESDIEKVDLKRASDNLELSAFFTSSDGDSAAAQVAEATSGTEAAEIMYVSKLTEPLQVNGSGEFTTFLQTALTLTASEFLAVNPDDAEYMLDQPEYTLISYTKEKGEIRVDFSKDTGGKYFAKTSLYPAVFTVETSSLSGIQMPLLSMVDVFLTYQMIADVEKVEGSFPEGSFLLELDIPKDASPADEESTVLLDGADARVKTGSSNSTYVSSLYASSACMRFSGFDFEASPENNADVTIVITMKDGTGKRIELTKRDESTYFVFLDGVYQGQLVSSDFLYKVGDTDLYGYGVWAMYQKTLEAMAGAVDGVYKLEK